MLVTPMYVSREVFKSQSSGYASHRSCDRRETLARDASVLWSNKCGLAQSEKEVHVPAPNKSERGDLSHKLNKEEPARIKCKPQ